MASAVLTALGAIHALLDAVRVERAALRKAEMLHAREHAPGFNMVDLFAPGETGLSGLFRWLLDERATHGQGDTFRRMFFETFTNARITEADWRGASVITEAPTRDGRRIDLLLESADRQAVLVVENKPWAGWQERQLESYWLDRRVDGALGRVKVLALVGGVEDAQAHIEAHWRAHSNAPPFPVGEVHGVGYDRVAAWIERCAAAARPAKVTALLRDLAVHIARRVGGDATMDEDAVARAIIEGGPERIGAALEVGAALATVLRRLSAMLTDQLRATDDFGDRWSATSTVDGSKFIGLTLTAIDGPILTYALFDVGGGTPWVGLVATDEQARDYDLNVLKKRRDGRWAAWEHMDDASLPGLADIHRGVIDGSFALRLLAHADALAAGLRRATV